MYLKRTFLAIAMLFLATVNAFSQETQLKVQLQASEKPVKLESLDVKVRIYGYLAETSMTMKFFNPNSRTLEGELYFPLPEGASVVGYALDVNGELVDGVAIEKDKAREVFETEVRRGVDPGLVEKVKGNNFKTRVYPLGPRQTRTIQVTFSDDLREIDGEALYRLPLSFAEKVERFNLRIEVPGQESRPVLTFKGVNDKEFVKSSSGWFSEISLEGAKLDSEMRVGIPQKNQDLVLVEQAEDGRHYFVIQGSRDPEIEESIAAGKVTLFFDVSDSGKNRDFKLEKEFLSKLYKQQVLNSQTEIRFIPFRNRVAKTQTLSLNNGLDDLFALIDGSEFDGASSFAALGELQDAGDDLIIVFSDGINTLGKNLVPEFTAPVIAAVSVDGADYSFLSAIAGRSGGKLINLREHSPIEAARIAAMPFWGISEKRSDRSAAELVPAGAQPVSGRFAVAGILEDEEALIALKFASATSKNSVAKYRVSRSAAVRGEFLRRFWAGLKIADLMAAKDENRSEIIKLSKKHGIVNEFTSLMVLERVEQYVEHRIIPPASKPAWRNAYFAAVEAEETRIERESSKNIEKILAMWNARLEWWKTDFSNVDLTRIKGKFKSVDLGGVEPRDSGDFRPRSPGNALQSIDSDSLAPQRPAAIMRESAISDEFESKNSVDEPSKKANKKDADGRQRSVNPGVAIKAWKPDAEYVRKIETADNQYAEYLKQKIEFGQAPSFYLDCSDFFNESGKADLALQVLSNLAELELENPALLRILGHRFAQLEELEASAEVFAEVLEMRKEEPQSYRDLALVLGRLGRYEEAVDLLYQVVKKTWDSRFPEIEVIALEELNNLVVKGKRAGVEKFAVDDRLIMPIDVDLRIVMTWDADMTDMDLWVMEPSGEKAFYSNPRTAIGGLVSRDFTRGYGPEEYMIRKARTGTYEIKTNFYGSSSQKIAGAVTLQVDVFTNYGREDEKRRSITLRLKENRETFTVAEIEF